MSVDHPADKNASGALAGEAARSLFSKFRALLEANTAALTTMAAMERMLGGEYIFDRAFLEKSAREVTDFAHQAVYAVNAMTGNRYVALYDRFMILAAAVEDILAGRPGTDEDRLIRPLARLRLEDRPKAGREGAALGELAGQLGLFVPRGFVVTLAAWNNGRLTDHAREAVAAALAHPEDGPNASAVTVSVAMVGAAGESVRQEARGVPAKTEAVLAALDGVSQAVLAELSEDACEIRATALVAATPPAVMRGQIRTYWREGDDPAFLRLDVWPDDDPATRDTFFLDRSHPFAARRSIISPKALDRRLPDGATSLEASPNGFLRGSSLLPFETAAALAGQAMAAERLLGAPTELGFCLEASGQTVFESIHPLAQAFAAATDTSPADVLLSGGEAACLGIASGMVLPVDETTPAAAFPFGAIAVTRSASPALTPLLRRAGAIVAEVGDAAGHLAAVAREYRVPALFGLPGALAALPKGMVVTVDAEAGLVARGASENRPAAESGLSPDDPEYLTLRRLLRRIATLTLTDPDAPEFSVDGCRTLHDILHFAHDQAVAVLADLRQDGISKRLATPLPLPVPLDLHVLDIGGGLIPGASGFAAVRSRPLAALLSGILTPGMWDTTPGRLGLGDILGAMGKALPAASGNLAIAARSYCNVSLRLGYHFTVVDAYICQNPEKNIIYFRFVGGLADTCSRAARAAFLKQVLSRYDFKVETAGDLVVARLKMIEPETAERALRLLGRLCAFARQRDTSLTSAADAEAMERLFFKALETADATQETP
jgi:pyruvate,water dikinase